MKHAPWGICERPLCGRPFQVHPVGPGSKYCQEHKRLRDRMSWHDLRWRALWRLASGILSMRGRISRRQHARHIVRTLYPAVPPWGVRVYPDAPGPASTLGRGFPLRYQDRCRGFPT